MIRDLKTGRASRRARWSSGSFLC